MSKVIPPDMPAGGTCRIAIVGEAPGREEEDEGRPFVGASGKLLATVLRRAGIDRGSCYVGNVFRVRPDRNDETLFFERPSAVVRQLVGFGLTKSRAQQLARLGAAEGEFAHLFRHPRYGDVGWLKPQHYHHVDALVADLEATSPSVIIALGAASLWALTGYSAITVYRGAVLPCRLGPWKVIPAFHPAYILRQYNQLPFLQADFAKAVRQSSFPEIRRPLRRVQVPETVEEVAALFRPLHSATALSYDIETEEQRILCISLSGDKSNAVVVPFEREGNHYWSPSDELLVWQHLRSLLEDTTMPKVAHNSLYDMSILSHYGIRPGLHSPTHDTQLLHHSLQPEMRKALGILGSLYLDEAPWKTMRTWAKARVNKSDE